MRELTGDLWQTTLDLNADAIVITTNGTVKKDGRAVMGRGVAREASEKWWNLSFALGRRLTSESNHAFDMGKWWGGRHLVTLPVKFEWWEKASPALIEQSLTELVQLATDADWKVVVLPRPGCGNGGLDWKDVRPLLEFALDDRFVVVYKEES